MQTQYKRFLIVFLVLFLILGGFILYASWPILTGTTIILDTMPFDPFDPLRGQYMQINYEISSIPVIEEANIGDTIYVSLKKDNESIWRYESASLDKPQKGIFIKGRIKSMWGENMDVEYGIEKFFFERHAKVPTRDLNVKVKVSNSGDARIIELLQNGKPVNITYKPITIAS